MCISENAEHILWNNLGQYFPPKEVSIGLPKIYLGGHVQKVELENGVEYWALGYSQYLKLAVKNVETYLTMQV